MSWRHFGGFSEGAACHRATKSQHKVFPIESTRDKINKQQTQRKKI